MVRRKKTKINKKYLILPLLTFLLIVISLLLTKSFDKHEPYRCEDCNLIIIADTNVKQDHLGVYGYYRGTSPNIDNFATDSLIFNDAYSHSSWTLPSATSFLTSLYPYEHKLTNREGEILRDEIITLADILKGKGYKTAIFTGGFDYSEKYGIVTRFDNVTTAPFNKFHAFGYGGLNTTIPLAIKWLVPNTNEKFFLFIQGYDAHCPFDPPKEFDIFSASSYNGSIDRNKCYLSFNHTNPIELNGKKYYSINSTSLNLTKGTYSYESAVIDEEDIKYLVDLYDGEIRFADDSIGKLFRILKESGLDKKTIIVVFSEHGDMFGKHGRFMRGGPLRGIFYDDVIRIPLIISHPKIEAKKVNGLVQLIDVMPTLLDFLGVKSNAKLSGKSLIPLIIEDTQVNEYIFAGTIFNPGPRNVYFKQPSRAEAVKNNEWKLIREILYSESKPYTITNVFYELYNLKEDPEELDNVYSENQAIFNKLNAELLKKLKRVGIDPYEIS